MYILEQGEENSTKFNEENMFDVTESESQLVRIINYFVSLPYQPFFSAEINPTSLLERASILRHPGYVIALRKKTTLKIYSCTLLISFVLSLLQRDEFTTLSKEEQENCIDASVYGNNCQVLYCLLSKQFQVPTTWRSDIINQFNEVKI